MEYHIEYLRPPPSRLTPVVAKTYLPSRPVGVDLNPDTGLALEQDSNQHRRSTEPAPCNILGQVMWRSRFAIWPGT